MFDRDASVLISRTSFIFRHASGISALSVPPSLYFFVSLLFSSESSESSAVSLSLSLSPFSSLPYYFYISQLVFFLTINMNSLDFVAVFPCLVQLVHAKNNNKKEEETKNKFRKDKTARQPQSLTKRITHI